MVNQSDTVVMDKEDKKSALIDVDVGLLDFMNIILV